MALPLRVARVAWWCPMRLDLDMSVYAAFNDVVRKEFDAWMIRVGIHDMNVIRMLVITHPSGRTKYRVSRYKSDANGKLTLPLQVTGEYLDISEPMPDCVIERCKEIGVVSA